jgi:short-subunit dehydrogenase
MIIKNKVWIITGGGNGMGREMVLGLLARGAKVAAIDINLAMLEETASLANAGKSLTIHHVDITDQQAVYHLPEMIITQHGQLDGLINNAGIIQPFVRVNDLDWPHIEKVMNVNFYGLLYMTKAFLPYLMKRPVAHIANVSSMGGFLPVPGQSVYGASKAAVKLLTEGLYSELKHTPVKVSIIFPGAIGTNITQNSGVVFKMPSGSESSNYKTLSPKTAAKIIIDGIEKNQYRIFVGSDSKFMDTLYRIAPEWATRFIAKKMSALLGK